MTPLARRIARQIAQTGPMTVAEYMALCLTDPDHGYYATRDPLGRGGDFTTAPEISQMFGELIGLALAEAWRGQGGPAGHLVELGPGRGTLIADALRATAGVPGFSDALRPALVEISPVLRAAQAERLSAYRPLWLAALDKLPEGPLFLIANEFFDALPIRQFERTGRGWAERRVGLAGGDLVFGLAPPVPIASLAHRLDETRQGEVVETSEPSAAIAAEIGRRIAARGGAAIIVDYGGWRSRGDTLQALWKGAYDPPLAHPGEADLTAHVDFEALALRAEAAGAAITPMTPQGEMLERLGITLRARALAGGAADAESIARAHRRLTHPEEMGHLFKSIAIHPRGSPPPPGFRP